MIQRCVPYSSNAMSGAQITNHNMNPSSQPSGVTVGEAMISGGTTLSLGLQSGVNLNRQSLLLEYVAQIAGRAILETIKNL